jgi:hypothetical protein
MSNTFLPSFPVYTTKPTEDTLERCVEQLMDQADRVFGKGLVTQKQYDAWVKRLDSWAMKNY